MKVVDVKDFGPVGFKWITLKRISWEDQEGRVRFWEAADRTTRTGAVDGVAVIAKVLRRGHTPHLLVISQYRPPLANHCLELPAGLVDGGEDAATAALRELREETGYTGRVVEVTPPCCSDPGLTGANMQLVTVEVDGDALENQGVVPQLDDGEFISTTLVPMHGLLQHLMDTQAEKGWEVDARLMAYATGLQQQPPAGTARAVVDSSAFGSPIVGVVECGRQGHAGTAPVHQNGGKSPEARTAGGCWEGSAHAADGHQGGGRGTGWDWLVGRVACSEFGAGLAVGLCVGLALMMRR